MKKIREQSKNSIEIAVDFLNRGKIISFATDTVYGIACDATNIKAVEQIYKIKKRQKDKPIAIFLSDISSAKKIFIFDDFAEKFCDKFLPGKVTIVMRTLENTGLARNLTNNEFLGFRIVKKKFISDLLDKFRFPLAVTSANISNETEALTAFDVEKCFQKS
jgi:L-threonylcarbamoyladenylate synthase